MGGNILCLQESHWVERDIGSLKKIWKGDCFINCSKSNSRGIGILIIPNFENAVSNILAKNEPVNNRFKTKQYKFAGNKRICSKCRNPAIFPEYSHITSAETNYTLLSGDLNLTLDPKLDCDNYRHINNPGAWERTIKNIITN